MLVSAKNYLTTDFKCEKHIVYILLSWYPHFLSYRYATLVVTTYKCRRNLKKLSVVNNFPDESDFVLRYHWMLEKKICNCFIYIAVYWSREHISVVYLIHIIYAEFVRSFANIMSKWSYTYFGNISSFFFILNKQFKNKMWQIDGLHFYVQNICYSANTLLIRILIDEMKCFKIKSTK